MTRCGCPVLYHFACQAGFGCDLRAAARRNENATLDASAFFVSHVWTEHPRFGMLSVRYVFPRCGQAAPRPGGDPLRKMAVLSHGSRRLPGITQRVCSNPTPGPVPTKTDEDQRRWRILGPLPGAACCHPTELPSYKAAPLPVGGHASPPA